MYQKTVPPWQYRRSQFNHDWLKNEFLNNLDGFLVMLQYENPSVDHLKDFLEKDFLSWPQHFEEGKGIIDSFEKEMTPAHLLDESPLNSMAPETREWFGDLVHSLWLCRCSVKETISSLSDLFDKTVDIYKAIKTRLGETGMSLDALKELVPEFSNFRERCFEFSETLSTLPSEVKYV